MITQKPNIHEQISSVQFSCSFVFDSLGPHGLQCARPPCLSPTPGVYSNSCPELVMPSNHLILFRPLLFWPSIFLSIRVFSRVSSAHQMAKVLGVSVSTSVLPMNIQDWFPFRWTGWLSLQSKGLSRVFANTTVQKHHLQRSAFFMVQLSHPYMTTGKTIALTR